MISAALVLALAPQASARPILGYREVLGEKVAIAAPAEPAFDPMPRKFVRLGEDAIARLGDQEFVSLRHTHPLKWMQTVGVAEPREDAVPLRVAVRIFSAVETASDAWPVKDAPIDRPFQWRYGFDDRDLEGIKNGLAAAEAYFETASQGQLDVQWNIILDPTPVRLVEAESVDSVVAPVLSAMARADSWENAEGKVTLPFSATLGVVPSNDAAPASVSGTRPPVGVLHLVRGESNALILQMEDALEQAFAKRAHQIGFSSSLSRVPIAPLGDLWKELCGYREASTEAFIDNQKARVLPDGKLDPSTAFRIENSSSAMVLRVRADLGQQIRSLFGRSVATMEGSDNMLIPGEYSVSWPAGTNPSSIWQTLGIAAPEPAIAPGAPNQMQVLDASEGSLKVSPATLESGSGLEVVHLGGTPFGRLPILRTPLVLAREGQVTLEFQAKSTVGFPICFSAGNGDVQLTTALFEPSRPTCSTIIAPNGEWQKVSVTLDAPAGPVVIYASVPPAANGIERRSQPGQKLTLTIPTIAEGGDAPVQSEPQMLAWPTSDNEANEWLTSGDANHRIAAVQYAVNGNRTGMLNAVLEQTRSVNFGLCLASLRAAIEMNPEKGTEALKYALEIGPFDHNRHAAALMMMESRPALVRALTTLVLANDWNTRIAAVRALAMQEGPDSNIALILLLTDPEPAVRLEAAQRVKLDGDLPYRRLLYTAVNDPAELVRIEAYAKLMNGGSKEFRDQGRTGLKDESIRVRASLLGRIQPEFAEESTPAILAALADRSAEVRAAAVTAMRRLNIQPTESAAKTLATERHPWVLETLQSRSGGQGQ